MARRSEVRALWSEIRDAASNGSYLTRQGSEYYLSARNGKVVAINPHLGRRTELTPKDAGMFLRTFRPHRNNDIVNAAAATIRIIDMKPW